MKLYQYFEDHGRMGSIEGLFFLSDEELKLIRGARIYWDELLGKHSEGVFDFSEENLTEIVMTKEAAAELFDTLGQVVSGPFDMEYILEEAKEQNG